MKTSNEQKGRLAHSLQRSFVALWLCAILVLSYLSVDGYSSPLMVPDEFGYITPAAFLAGYDWSSVTQGLPWYSFGYSLILLPAFLVLEPEAWYRGAQLVNGLLLLAIVPLLAATVRRSGVEVRSSIIPWVAALLVLLYPSVLFYSRLAVSETLILAVILLAVLAVQWTIRRGLRWFDLLVLGGFCASLYFIHSRLIATVAAAVLMVSTVAFLRFGIKGAAKTAGTFVVGMMPVMLAGQKLKAFFIAELYGGSLYGEQHSLAESISARFRNLGDVDGIVSLLSVGAGQTTYLLVSTLGVGALGVVWSVKRASNWSGLRSERNGSEVVVPMFLLLNLALTLVVSVLALSNPAFPHHVFYGRYTEPAILPVFAVGIAAIFSGEVRWRWLLFVSAFVFAVLAPAAMKLASGLPAENTYWILISGLFAFRQGDWEIGYPLLFFGFVVSATIIGLSFRANSWVGTGVIALLFALASMDVVKSHRDAGITRQTSYAALTDSARLGSVPVVYELEDDSLFMRTEVQLLNPRGLILMSQEEARASGSDSYEVIRHNGAEVKHAWCTRGTAGQPVCNEISPERQRFQLEPAWTGNALVVSEAVSPADLLISKAGNLPFLRVLDVGEQGIEFAIKARWLAGDDRGIRLVTFVTPKGQASKWLNDVRASFEIPSDGEWQYKRARASLLAYDGTPLPPGEYEINIVLQSPARYMWGTRFSTTLKIVPAR